MPILLRSPYSSLLDRMRKSLPTCTGAKILGRRTFLWSTLKAVAFVLNGSGPHLCDLKKHEQEERFVQYEFFRTREVSATQLPIETIVAPVGKSESELDLQTDIIFDGNGGVKINKSLAISKVQLSAVI